MPGLDGKDGVSKNRNLNETKQKQTNAPYSKKKLRHASFIPIKEREPLGDLHYSTYSGCIRKEKLGNRRRRPGRERLKPHQMQIGKRKHQGTHEIRCVRWTKGAYGTRRNKGV